MLRTSLIPHSVVILLLTGLVCFWSIPVMAQPPEEPDQPRFITELVDRTELTQDQVDQMRSDSTGWGNIMISMRLAEQMAAADNTLPFDDALAAVLDARAQGKGFGQIAHENDLKIEQGAEDNETPYGTNQPPFIAELVEKTDLTIEQVEQMRSDGAGWGNIAISTRLAERIAADTGSSLSFEDALDAVLDARAEGKGFGEIAHENDLKVGRVVGKGKAMQAGAGPQARVERRTAKAKKKSFFGRLMSALRIGSRGRPEKPPKFNKTNKPERPERPAKPQKLEKPERPERPEKLEKPEKPEKPERGPRK